ncbi:thioesterase [Rhodococcus erythropolis]|uniref:acyl-[acyl-carrier-protein] thioesterase n=1 Tax=Rhodococcus erythropolis TaxID=1833 RepID=UPI002948C894|nr:acyl-ACP thioesterase domain-containing protein [Rhodococcus erythropolis]MDV6274972.1 thioesterase [Rhodococcus erythropolis]
MRSSASRTHVNRGGSVRDPLPKRPTLGEVFSNSWPVRTGDVHPDRSLRLDAIARYLHDLGFDNLEANGAARTHPVWLVRRTVIDAVRPIIWPDTVRLHRWCSALSSRWCTMRVNIESEAGELIETDGFWININPQNGMPSRISEDFLALLTSTTDQHRLSWQPWIRTPGPNTEGQEFPLRASDVDPFHHLNNAVYWQPAESVMRKHPTLREEPLRAVLEYIKPTTADETVEIRTNYDAVASTAWFVCAGETHAIAHFMKPPADTTGSPSPSEPDGSDSNVCRKSVRTPPHRASSQSRLPRDVADN